jgi:hypothetical protein
MYVNTSSEISRPVKRRITIFTRLRAGAASKTSDSSLIPRVFSPKKAQAIGQSRSGKQKSPWILVQDRLMKKPRRQARHAYVAQAKRFRLLVGCRVAVAPSLQRPPETLLFPPGRALACTGCRVAVASRHRAAESASPSMLAAAAAAG